MIRREILAELPVGLRVAAAGVGVTGTMSAVLAVARPGLLPLYGGLCVAVYGGAGAVLAIREGWLRQIREQVAERLSWATVDPYEGPDGPTVCESCRSRLAVREVLTDGIPFAVCESCTPPTPVVLAESVHHL